MPATTTTNLDDIRHILLGNAITATAYSWVIVPANIASGGVTASSMIAATFTNWSVTTWTNLITSLCLLAAWRFLGRRNFINSLISSVSYMSFFTLAQQVHPFDHLSLWLGLPFAGIAVGIGYALCLTHHASTAGLDVIALIIHRAHPKIPTATSLRVINLLVLGASAWTFGWQSLGLGVIFILLYTQCLAVINNQFNQSDHATQ